MNRIIKNKNNVCVCINIYTRMWAHVLPAAFHMRMSDSRSLQGLIFLVRRKAVFPPPAVFFTQTLSDLDITRASAEAGFHPLAFSQLCGFSVYKPRRVQ